MKKIASGLIDSNSIHGNTRAGIVIRDFANPVVSNNILHDGKGFGISVCRNGRGDVKADNQFSDNRLGNFVVSNGHAVVDILAPKMDECE